MSSEVVTREDLKNILNEVLPSVAVDYVVDQGTTSDGWTYRKWNSGRLDCERVHNIGTYTIGTVEVAPIRVGGTITTVAPSIVVGGTIEVALSGNSSNSACFLEKISDASWRVAKVVSSSVTLSNMTVIERIVNGTWK